MLTDDEINQLCTEVMSLRAEVESLRAEVKRLTCERDEARTFCDATEQVLANRERTIDKLLGEVRK